MSTRLAAAAALVLATALAPPAGAARITPSAMLARELKASMQSFYARRYHGLEITTVTCTIAGNGTTGHCLAHFTIGSRHADGVFTLLETIDPTIGSVSTKTLAVSCHDSRTGTRRRC